jgi:hypothetical protein
MTSSLSTRAGSCLFPERIKQVTQSGWSVGSASAAKTFVSPGGKVDWRVRLKRERFRRAPLKLFLAVFCRLINPDQAN